MSENSPLIDRLHEGKHFLELSAPKEKKKNDSNKWKLVVLIGGVILACFVFYHGLSYFRAESHEYIPFSYRLQNSNTTSLLKPIATYQPNFTVESHPIKPHMISSSLLPPFPTNQFWTNLLISDSIGTHTGAGPVTLSPFTVKSTVRGLHVSYDDTRRVVNIDNITTSFNSDMIFGCTSPTMNRTVVRYDSLTVDVEFTTNMGKYVAYLARGSPYISVNYLNATPLMSFNGMIQSINGLNLNTSSSLDSSMHMSTNDDGNLEINILVGASKQKWMIYMPSKQDFIVKIISSNLSTELELKSPVNGVIRSALIPVEDDAAKYLLTAYSQTVPRRANIKYSVEGNKGYIMFQWGTIDGNDSLLMLADPHHIDSFKKPNSIKICKPIGHRSLKGFMTPVIGSTWILSEDLTTKSFDFDRVPKESYQINEIIQALRNDSKFTPNKTDPYFFGKEVSRQSRLALIANQLNQGLIREEILDKLEIWLSPWLNGTNNDSFVYDNVWGGLCTRNGLSGIFWMTDFGNGWYNDHHFHYGYIIYTLAVIGRFRPHFLHQHIDAVYDIVRDIANPTSHDPYFPLARHFSWYDGHSFASGVFVIDGGKSQESVSEAINAYYAVYLIGLSLRNDQLINFGRILLAMEIRAAQTYWQMKSSSVIYEPMYAQNKMTGQVALTKVFYTTWFGKLVEYIHLINMIPFTPITQEFINENYVKEQYPVLVHKALHRINPKMTDSWKGYACLNHAIIDPKTAWKEIINITEYDDGNSRTNSLMWIATRP